MNQSVLPGFEFLLMGHEANNESISDSEFRGMIYDLMLRKVELMEDRMPKVQLT